MVVMEEASTYRSMNTAYPVTYFQGKKVIHRFGFATCALYASALAVDLS
jgi:hypothetical protein